MHRDGRRLRTLAAIVAATGFLTGCATAPSTDGADEPPSGGFVPPPDAVPRPESRSKYGNGPVYEVFGERYTVLDSASGYAERGVASWYGKKFHGRLTSNREPYDMYEMTAAHKSLPLPSYVRVRNLANDRSVIVRVNDRGPFVHNRIIDLSYAAAMKLDMVDAGTSLVEVTAITFDEPTGDRPVRAVTPAAPPTSVLPPTNPAGNEAVAQETDKADAGITHEVFAQIGAFGSRENAELRLEALHQRGILNAFIDPDDSVEPLFRVRVGPITEVEQFDMLVEELGIMGIPSPYLVAE